MSVSDTGDSDKIGDPNETSGVSALKSDEDDGRFNTMPSENYPNLNEHGLDEKDPDELDM